MIPPQGAAIHLEAFNPQPLQTSDRCTGEAYYKMLGHMSIDPDVDLTAFWRQGETVMADRDGSVARAVNFAIHNSMATQHDEMTCRQHQIHDIASDRCCAYLGDDVKAIVHVQHSFEDAFGCAEFRGIMREEYRSGFTTKRGTCPPHATTHRRGFLNTFLPLEFENGTL